jgi:tetratricopeptide (TPR) repeat protein
VSEEQPTPEPIATAGRPLDSDSALTRARPYVPTATQRMETAEPNADTGEEPSMVGTVPAHDIAQALREVMGDVPDIRDLAHVDEQDTQTRLPEEETGAASGPLPAFELDEDPASEPAPRSGVTRAVAPELLEELRAQIDAGSPPPTVRRSVDDLLALEASTNETPGPRDTFADLGNVEALDPEEIIEDTSTDVGLSAPAFDAEEAELIAEHRHGALLAMYRQRLGAMSAASGRAALLLKIASVYENRLLDVGEAFQAAVDAFEEAPLDADVIKEVDRLASESGRIAELAERVRRQMIPTAPEEKKVPFLAHVVYWYGRLGRGSEASPLVSEIERKDRKHPIVLRRSAQIAAMNGDVKLQREVLERALDRAMRADEKAAIHLELAVAYAGTRDESKHYQAALHLDPSSLVALEGLKRLAHDREQYPQVQWALERQIEIAESESERIRWLLELADLQETKFLKREIAAELLERVISLEPAHAPALKALERCYHALRDWAQLARVLSMRAEHTTDRRARIEVFELAAEVHESKLGNLPGAIEAHTNILLVDPKHRRALADLARLYEKLSDWENVATYKARLAELAPTKRATSQELVKLGDLLGAAHRYPLGARLQYERAVSFDPTNAAAWEALQRLAQAEGDDHRAIQCLQERKTHTEIPRQRAAVLVELAQLYTCIGDASSAQDAYAAANRADPTNEPAAVAMLEVYTAEERWAEAAPLCELLVNAAIRDRDEEALFMRLRLGTRIAASLGDVERAVVSAMAALDARPTDEAARADLIAVCTQSPEASGRARAHLAKVAAEPQSLEREQTLRLADLEHAAGDLDSAARLFEHARHANPEDAEVAARLADVYLAQGDYARACKLKVDLARNATSAEARFDLFVEAGEIWARRADELEKGASLFEEARAIRPEDPWLLQTLLWLYGELGEWERLTDVLEVVARTQESVPERVKTLVTLSEIVQTRLGDTARTVDVLDRLLDLDRTRLEAFEEQVRTLTEAKDWERLERAYRRMIERIANDGKAQLEHMLYHQLGLIYRDRLGDAARAYEALDAASRIQPDDQEVRKIVVELLVVTDNLDNAVLRVREAIERTPLDPVLYADLYDLFLRQRHFDKAWCAVNVLTRMTDPTPEQLRFHEDYAPVPLDEIPGQIVEQAWSSHVFHADLHVGLTNLYALMTPAVARLRFSQLRPEQRVGRPFTPNQSRMHDLIRATFANAAEILAFDPPDLLLGDPASKTPFKPALAPFGAILVSTPQVEHRPSSLVYLIGKRLAEQRRELAARAFFPGAPELSSLLGTAIRMARNESAMDAAQSALDASFNAILSHEEREGIKACVLAATDGGAHLDVQKWSRAADLSSMRAGLLLAGDVLPARDAILGEEPIPSDLTAEEKIAELYKFATSDLYSDLRGAIGVAVQG